MQYACTEVEEFVYLFKQLKETALGEGGGHKLKLKL